MSKSAPFLSLLLLASSCQYFNPFLLGAPCAVTTNRGPQICWKGIGFEPFDCSQGQTPDFARAATDWGLPGTGAKILAMSIGTDVIHVLQKTLGEGDFLDGQKLTADDSLDVAVAQLPGDSHGWMAIGFTVNSAEIQWGVDQVASEIKTAHEAGELDQSIFNYIVDGSQLPPELYTVGTSQRILAPQDMGLGPGDEIHALNLNMAMYHADLDYPSFFDPPRPLPEFPTIYFTVEPANAVDATWFETYVDSTPVTNAAAPSSATILASRWGGASWSPPRVFRTYQDMRLKPTDHIDGLSIDIETTSGTQEILFSTRDAMAENQLMHMLVGDVFARRFVIESEAGWYGSGGLELGIGRGLGDFCTEDPAGRRIEPTAPMQLDDYFIARRAEPDAEGTLQLGVSGFRWKRSEDSTIMRSCMEFRGRPDRPLTAVAKWTVATFDGATLGPRDWTTAEKKAFENFPGRHLVVDIPFPKNPASDQPHEPTGSQAMVVQWTVRDGSTTYVGPLVVMRF